MPLVLCCRTMSAGTVLMDWGGHRNIITCFFFVIVFHGKVCTTPTCYYNTGDAKLMWPRSATSGQDTFLVQSLYLELSHRRHIQSFFFSLKAGLDIYEADLLYLMQIQLHGVEISSARHRVITQYPTCTQHKCMPSLESLDASQTEKAIHLQ